MSPTLHHKAKDLTGRVFGRLTAKEPVGRCRYGVIWRCECTCGKEVDVVASRLGTGNRKSCGCLVGVSNITHGHTSGGGRTSEYRSWSSMKRRCLDPRREDYPRYGGRGITVCDRWIDSFEAFLADVGPKPSRRHSLDRLDGDGNYEPGNVRWATPTQQQRNLSTNRVLSYGGRTQTSAEWAEELGLNYNTLQGRLRLGWSVERALTTPCRPVVREPPGVTAK